MEVVLSLMTSGLEANLQILQAVHSHLQLVRLLYLLLLLPSESQVQRGLGLRDQMRDTHLETTLLPILAESILEVDSSLVWLQIHLEGPTYLEEVG